MEIMEFIILTITIVWYNHYNVHVHVTAIPF